MAAMNLLFWNVYHNYSTYFIEPINSLDEVARRLLLSGLCEAAYSTNGLAYWNTTTGVRISPVNIERHGYSNRANVQLPSGLDGYPAECVYQASYMRFLELLLFNKIFIEQTGYLRAFMQPVLFSFEQRQVILYPQIKLFKNGVITICFRSISPEQTYLINDLIEKQVNLFKHNADDIEIAPFLLKLITRVLLLNKEKNPILRHRVLRVISSFDKTIDTGSSRINLQDFSHQFVSIKPFEEIAEAKPVLNFDVLIEYISSAVALVLNQPNQGLKYFIFGAKNYKMHLGSHWMNRPNVCIVEFEDQPNTSSEISQKFAEDLGRVMARSISIPRERAIEMLPKSVRLYEDFGLYISKAIGLCVYSKQGLNREERHKDINRSELIFPIQIQSEFMDYIHYSYLRQEERSLIAKNISKLFSEKGKLFQLDKIVRSSTSYGELENLFSHTWKCFDLEGIKQSIYENTELKVQGLQEFRDKRNNRFSSVLAISFGLVGVTSLAKDVVEPIWNSFGWWIPSNVGLQPLFFFGITASSILVVLALLWFWTSRVQRDFF